MTPRQAESQSICDLKSFPARFAKRAQRTHVLIYNAIPLAMTGWAIFRMTYVPLQAFDVILVVSMWSITLGFGGTVGFHRYFAHRSFEASSLLRCMMAVCGSMSAQGPPMAWVCTHRRHHECSDVVGDPHSPNLLGNQLKGRIAGLWHAHCGWLIGHEIPNPRHYCPDLIRDQTFVRINSLYPAWVVLGILIPTVASAFWYSSVQGAFTGLLWGGFVRISITSQAIWSVNSICHHFGSRPFKTRERSTNNIALAIPSFGESWHNNHHAFPTSARFGLKWWQIDLGYIVIASMQLLGLVWNVRTPTRKHIEVAIEKSET